MVSSFLEFGIDAYQLQSQGDTSIKWNTFLKSYLDRMSKGGRSEKLPRSGFVQQHSAS